MKYKVRLEASCEGPVPQDFIDLVDQMADHLANSVQVLEHHLWCDKGSGDFGVFLLVGGLSDISHLADVEIVNIVAGMVGSAGLEVDFSSSSSNEPVRTSPHPYSLSRELEPVPT